MDHWNQKAAGRRKVLDGKQRTLELRWTSAIASDDVMPCHCPYDIGGVLDQVRERLATPVQRGTKQQAPYTSRQAAAESHRRLDPSLSQYL
jgi:hypothetical protein